MEVLFMILVGDCRDVASKGVFPSSAHVVLTCFVCIFCKAGMPSWTGKMSYQEEKNKGWAWLACFIISKHLGLLFK